MDKIKYSKILFCCGAALSFIDIFLMFGEAFVAQGYHATMMNFAFGTGGWKELSGINTIFVLQVFIVISALIYTLVIMSKKDEDIEKYGGETSVIVVAIIPLVLSFTNAIMGFSTLKLAGLDGSTEIGLGGGAIGFGIVDILVFLLILFGIVLIAPYAKRRDIQQPVVKTSQEMPLNPVDPGTPLRPSTEQVDNKALEDSSSNEDPVAALQNLKTLLDAGAITKQEFDSLKAKYLKKL